MQTIFNLLKRNVGNVHVNVKKNLHTHMHKVYVCICMCLHFQSLIFVVVFVVVAFIQIVYIDSKNQETRRARENYIAKSFCFKKREQIQ